MKEMLKEIREQTGLILTPDTYFVGYQKGNYFNVILKDRVSESKEFQALERFVTNSKTFYKVEPNGLHRVAIFFNGGTK